MASIDIKNRLGVTDKRTGRGTTTTPVAAALYTNTRDIASMRARLQAIDSGMFSTARLDTMTHNDMVYALRVIDDPAGI